MLIFTKAGVYYLVLLKVTISQQYGYQGHKFLNNLLEVRGKACLLHIPKFKLVALEQEESYAQRPRYLCP